MVDAIQVAVGILFFLLIIMQILFFIDYSNKRTLKKKPFVSFVISCYNDGAYVEETVNSIYRSYDRDKFELLMANDGSTDNSLEVLKRLQKKYGFKLIDNPKNIGKHGSINNLCDHAKAEVLFFLDADVIINRKLVVDVLARLQEKNMGAVSSPYRARNKGFLALMQEMQYNFFSLIAGSYNLMSGISIWGGCFAVNREAFEKVGRLSKNMIIEDMDMALKLNEKGYRVQQSFCPVLTYVPDTWRSWYHQQIRWSSGFTQNLLKHFRMWLKHPFYLLFTTLFFVLSATFVILLIRQLLFVHTFWGLYKLMHDMAGRLFIIKEIAAYYHSQIVSLLLANLYFSFFSLPYIIPMIKKLKDIYKVLYILPYTALYNTVMIAVFVIGGITGFFRYHELKEGGRPW